MFESFGFLIRYAVWQLLAASQPVKTCRSPDILLLGIFDAE
jgi:hypothetical protein